MVEWIGLKRAMHVAQMVRIEQREGQNQNSAENPTEANGLFLGHRMTSGAVPRIANCFLRFSFRRAFEDLTVTDVNDKLATGAFDLVALHSNFPLRADNATERCPILGGRRPINVLGAVSLLMG